MGASTEALVNPLADAVPRADRPFIEEDLDAMRQEVPGKLAA
jgi:hypothetical protein